MLDRKDPHVNSAFVVSVERIRYRGGIGVERPYHPGRIAGVHFSLQKHFERTERPVRRDAVGNDIDPDKGRLRPPVSDKQALASHQKKGVAEATARSNTALREQEKVDLLTEMSLMRRWRHAYTGEAGRKS